MWSRLYNNDSQLIQEINRVDFWQFEFQQNTPVNYTIRRGDRVNTHCVYDTKGSTPLLQYD